MTAACDSSLPSVSNRSTALALAAPAPVATGEDLATYDDLLARVTAAVKPNGVLEDLWVRDATDDAWDVLRLRRYKAGYLAASASDGMKVVLLGLGEMNSLTLSHRWAAREPTALGDVRERLETAGLGQDAVMGSAFVKHIDAFERIERLIGAAMARRAATLREIAQHRAELAEQLAAATQMAAVEDAEYTVVTPSCASDGRAAEAAA
jgi:hypothetical protein